MQRGQEFIKHLVRGASEVHQVGDPALEVLVVTHGGFIQLLLKSVCGLKGVNVVNNTSFSTIDIYSSNTNDRLTFEPVLINDTRHLQDNGLMSASKW